MHHLVGLNSSITIYLNVWVKGLYL